jgi:DNA repair exonuclease SbcCD ATPase subunit
VLVALTLPTEQDVKDKVGRVENVSRNSGNQVRSLRGQLEGVRARQPRLKQSAEQLQLKMAEVKVRLKKQQPDEETLRKMSESLGRTADDFQALGDGVSPEALVQLAQALEGTAEFLEGEVVPGDVGAARELEDVSRRIRTGAALLRGGTADRQSVRDLIDALRQFSAGLERLEASFNLPLTQRLRRSLRRFDDPLDEVINRLDALASISYPVVTVKGIQPIIESKPLWPEGKEVVAMLRMVSLSSATLQGQLATLDSAAPRARSSIEEARRAVDLIRITLETAAAHQVRLQELLKTPPEKIVRAVEQASALAEETARTLRSTEQLRKVVLRLRELRQRLADAAERAPKLRDGLIGLAEVLRRRQADLQELIDNPGPYRTTLNQTLNLIDVVTAALPLFTDHLDTKLEEEDQSLEQLENSINEVTEVMPEVSRTASRLMQLTRWLLYLGAAIFGLHGVYLTFHTQRQPQRTWTGEDPQ